MKIKPLEIPDEGLEIAVEAKTDRWFCDLVQEAFQEGYPLGGLAALNLDLRKTCENVAVSGMVEIDLHPTCDRCLEPFERHLTIPIHVDLAPHRSPQGVEGVENEPPEEDLNFAFYTGDEFDVGEIVREILLLEVPFRYLCEESCKGLCPRCGQNLNDAHCGCRSQTIDPRLAPLKNLR